MTELIGVVAVVVVAWFAAGTFWNVRMGSAFMRWMQDGLPLLGSRTTMRWLGSTAVEMVLSDAKPPFAAVTLVIFLEPRDLPWWPISRARGRRDTLIVRGVLRSAPSVEFEALAPRSWSGRDALPRVPAEWALRKPTSPDGLAVHHASAAALARADALLGEARQAGLPVTRLSVRRAEPHFQLHVDLPGTGQSARRFLEIVHAFAERALT